MTTLSRIGTQKWISRQDLFERVVKYIIGASCEISVADFPWRAEETLQTLVS